MDIVGEERRGGNGKLYLLLKICWDVWYDGMDSKQVSETRSTNIFLE